MSSTEPRRTSKASTIAVAALLAIPLLALFIPLCVWLTRAAMGL